jgi:hypothetical protein
MDKDELIASYKYEKDRQAKVEKAQEIQKRKLSGICKTLLEEHGKGPHDLGDGNADGWIVIQKGDTCYLSPVRKKAASG